MDIEIRPSVEEDKEHLIAWLQQPGVLRGFPIETLPEIEDAARIWISYAKIGAVLTAVHEGKPCGIANLYIQPYKKLRHQSLFAIIVDEAMRGKGVGTRLLEALIQLGKEKFQLELLHLEVYEHNPALRLYKRLGFSEYGRHRRFLKDQGEYLTKIFMQREI